MSGLEEQVARHRELMFRGVDETAYRTTVEVLSLIARNLDPEGTHTPEFRQASLPARIRVRAASPGC
jgi:hypothetical protein